MVTKQFYLIITVSIITLLTQVQVFAAPPRKPNVGLFRAMIDNSPFTIKPERVEVVKESPLERDWALAGISPSGDGFSVTLMNKKDRSDRIRFLPGFSAGEYKLLEVKQDAVTRSNSKVHIQKGSQKAWITYDENLLKVATKKGPKPKVSTARKPIVKNELTPQTPPGVRTRPTISPTRRVRRVPSPQK